MAENHDLFLATQSIEGIILIVHGQKVILDSDIAKPYSVTSKRLLQQVTRNINRFPDDFMFQLTTEENEEVVANCNHLVKLISS